MPYGLALLFLTNKTFEIYCQPCQVSGYRAPPGFATMAAKDQGR